MFAVILFIASVAGGICACMTQSPILLLGLLVLEMAFVQTVPACRGYETIWEFVLFSGTMLPVHLFWLFPLIVSSDTFDAYGIATVFMILYGLFSVELLLVLFLTRSISRYRKKCRPLARKYSK